MNTFSWLNTEKNRFYNLTIENYGKNTIALTYVWGSYNTNRGGKKNILVKSEDEVTNIICKLMKRRSQRGYKLIMSSSIISRALH